jgi:hypothetical protein
MIASFKFFQGYPKAESGAPVQTTSLTETVTISGNIVGFAIRQPEPHRPEAPLNPLDRKALDQLRRAIAARDNPAFLRIQAEKRPLDSLSIQGLMKIRRRREKENRRCQRRSKHQRCRSHLWPAGGKNSQDIYNLRDRLRKRRDWTPSKESPQKDQ